MWIFTTLGFFSIVQKHGTTNLTVRARAKSDLDALRENYLPSLSPTVAKGGTDYPWRATVDHSSFAEALKQMALDVNYDNFKDTVAVTQGSARASIYHGVWAALRHLPESKPQPAKTTGPSNHHRTTGSSLLEVALGGVVIRADGHVLLREPLNHYDGYVWTFPKGRPGPKESRESAALREVLEETGLKAKIIAPIPGEYAGGTTSNCYYLMEESQPGAPLQAHDDETSCVRWAAYEEAKHLLQETTNPKGRVRDLAVLEAAFKLWKLRQSR